MIFPHPDHRYGSIVSNGKSLSIVNLLLTIFVLNYEYKDIKFLTLPTTQFEVPPSEKIAWGFQQAGKKEGGWGEGIFARLPKKRSPAALLVQSRVPQKSFFFLLEEKKSRAK